jgi:hypothetical protein
MNVYPTADDFKNAYIRMEAALREKTRNDTLCEYCSRLGIASIFESERDDRALEDVEFSYDSLSNIAKRSSCPFCRLLWRLLRSGNDNCCKAACREPLKLLSLNLSLSQFLDTMRDEEVKVKEFYLPKGSQLGWVTISVAGQVLSRHLAYGDLHFVHATQVDHTRVKEWISTCEENHRSCNEQFGDEDTPENGKSGLFGYSEGSLRVIDVELRRVVHSSSPLRYLTLSYVWGDNTDRTVEQIEDPGQENIITPPNIRIIKKQPKALIDYHLARTFEDAITFTRRLGERYLWIDCLCIPQDHRMIKEQQISKMDKIYSGGICTLVSLTSGVDRGLPGASYHTKRRVEQYFEQLPNGSKISAHLMNLPLIMEEAAWHRRAWTLQEYLLSRRIILFGEHQVFFICKEMSAKESWTRPHTSEDESEDVGDWAEINLPFYSGKRSKGLTKAYKTAVQMYSIRHLTFSDDRQRAFEGIQMRLSRMYDVKFLYGMPTSMNHFLEALLWRHESQNPVLMIDLESSPSALKKWPSWSWLGYPGGVDYMPFSLWNHRKDFTFEIAMPNPEVFFQSSDGRYLPLSQNSVKQSFWNPTLLRIWTLALDIDITQWDDRRQSQYPPLEIWKTNKFPTARGVISFHLGIVSDRRKKNRRAFPEGTKMVRLIRLNKNDRPKVPWVQVRGESARILSPVNSDFANDGEISPCLVKDLNTKKETRFSLGLDWVNPEEGAAFSNALEPDACLLIVEANESSVAAKRLGVAYVRMMDFLVAGAEEREVVLG